MTKIEKIGLYFKIKLLLLEITASDVSAKGVKLLNALRQEVGANNQ